MKSRMIKLMACMLTGAVIMTAGAGTVLAAPTDTVSETEETTNTVTSPESGISLLLSQVAEHDDSAAQETKTEEPEAADKKSEEKTDDYKNLGVAKVDDYVNIRKKASTDSEIVGKLKKNAVATVTKEKGDWYAIKSGSVTGYVKKEFLVVGDEELINSVKYRMAKVETETLRVREKAAEDADVITLVSEDDKLKVINEDKEGWVKVKTSDGKGYVSAEYVKVYDTFKYAEKPEAEQSSSGSGSGGSGVASYALQFVGNPYVWGGSSLTNGADCSGFIMSVYAHYGISLPHSSYALRNVGRKVSYSEAQPGDIICYSGHVALYIGGGQIVHASNKRDGIKVSNATYRSIITVRRVL